MGACTSWGTVTRFPGTTQSTVTRYPRPSAVGSSVGDGDAAGELAADGKVEAGGVDAGDRLEGATDVAEGFGDWLGGVAVGAAHAVMATAMISTNGRLEGFT